jgi:glutathione S-transferase
VPILRHGNITVWESLAILEYLAEIFPEKNLWPKRRAARALARAISSEMHAGFSALRTACPMNLRRPRKHIALSDAVKADVQRIEEIWRESRTNFGKSGKFLFGKFCNADAMFAPVVTRFDTYDVKVAKETRQYMENVMATPAFKRWKVDGLKESSVIPHYAVD